LSAERPPVVVDTSVWISWLIPTDVNNATATNWLVGHSKAGGQIYAPSFLLAELAGAIRRATGIESHALDLANLLENFPPLTIVPMDAAMIDETVRVAARFALTGASAIYVAMARLLSVPLVTFDREQLTRPVGYIITVRP